MTLDYVWERKQTNIVSLVEDLRRTSYLMSPITCSGGWSLNHLKSDLNDTGLISLAGETSMFDVDGLPLGWTGVDSGTLQSTRAWLSSLTLSIQEVSGFSKVLNLRNNSSAQSSSQTNTQSPCRFHH